MNTPDSSKLTKDDVENIVTTAFIKEMQSNEYENEYTAERRLQVILTLSKLIERIQKDNLEFV